MQPCTRTIAACGGVYICISRAGARRLSSRAAGVGYYCPCQRIRAISIQLTWVVVALAIALALGPILWLLPSKRDKRLAELRAAARRAGLVVELVAVPKLDADATHRVSPGGVARDAKVDCAAYRLPLPRPLPAAPCWRLLKSKRECDGPAGWTSLDPALNLPVSAQDYWHRIGQIADSLPGGCIGIQADARMIAWLGVERAEDATAADVVADIRAGLEAIGMLHQQLDGAAGSADI